MRIVYTTDSPLDALMIARTLALAGLDRVGTFGPLGHRATWVVAVERRDENHALTMLARAGLVEPPASALN